MTDHPAKNDEATLSDRIEGAADRVGELARDQAEALTEKATQKAETTVSNVSDAAAAALDELESGSVQAEAADQIASHLQDAAAMLREADFSTAASKATAFARENPVLFLGGAVLLGFAAARFLKASDPTSHETNTDDSDPWTGHVSGMPSPAAAAQATSAQHDDSGNGRVHR
ncbi:hypothetical protein [Roseobacter denitrificans]|uniref:DUF3618 domain-containing protein n=1 Tax=Roseobacter denitrificans (strain ATCC 33942 / OCh 114) TaxID=375451 RepID=Q166Q0_ROSDO|nr:hypothetical protein [Roseobacter denitrificans]ABG32043.1 hypothetical protein RD1_2478 [Roseobacter denitrificans OCh 114]SFG36758.1 hypothetical protein SAMN05443635_114111 [Roseobacter denitrificans OCh 114]